MAKKRDTRGTLEYFMRYTWKEMNRRTVNGQAANTPHNRIKNASYFRKGIMLLISREEFRNFCTDNWDTIKLLYESGKTPSIDRIDSNGHYELGNIRILDKRDNSSRKLNVINSKK